MFDLKNYLSDGNKKVEVVGLIRNFIDTPPFLKNLKTPENTVYAVVDIIGVNIEILGVLEEHEARGVGVFLVPMVCVSLKNRTTSGKLLGAFSGRFRLHSDGETIIGITMFKKHNIWNGNNLRFKKEVSENFKALAAKLWKQNWDLGYTYTGDVNLSAVYDSTEKEVESKTSAPPMLDSIMDNLTLDRNFNSEPTALVEENPLPSLAPFSPRVDELDELVEVASEKNYSLLTLLFASVSDFDLKPYYMNVRDNYKNNWHQKGIGKDLFVQAVCRIFSDKYTESFIEGIADIVGASFVDAVFARDTYTLRGNGATCDQLIKDIENLNEPRAYLLLATLEELSRVRGLITTYELAEYDTTVIKLMLTNPYNLVHYNSNLKKEPLDRLALIVGVDLSDKEIARERGVALLYAFIMQQDDTLIRKQDLYRLKLERDYTQKEFNTFEKVGYIEPFVYLEKLYDVIFNGLTGNNDFYNRFVIKKEALGSASLSDVVKDALSSGLLVEYNGFVISTNYLIKELYIYRKLYSLAENITPIEGIDQKIEEFELMKAQELKIPEFKLEERQRDSFNLVKYGASCVTGPAGSGKTTTAEGIVYCFETLLGIPRDEIYFVAPTAKAAKRLKESVKRPTSTMHRLFKIGKNTIATEDYLVNNIPTISLLIIDESAMADINLMYTVLKRYSGARVMFLGDIEQLPAIGSGKVFGDLLNILPTVRLNVSKRASEKSLITRNSKELCTSDLAFKTGDDFKMISCEASQTSSIIRELCNYHIHGKPTNLDVAPVGLVDYRDIQVMSPVNKYDWGVNILNAEISSVFNPSNTDVYIRSSLGTTREFRVKDKVIHTQNEGKTPRYYKHDDGSSFTLLESEGVMNGDMGYVTGIHRAKDVVIDDSPLSSNPSSYVMEVTYEDINESGEPEYFIILYHFTVKGKSKNCLDAVGLSPNVSLAYALTVHKMQGSQAKVIIIALQKAGNFISRNMVYTAITRAEQVVYIVGNLGTIEDARRNEVSKKRKTVLGLLAR